MKILYVGNLANIGYYHVKELRKLSVDIDLLMEKNPLPTADPLLRDPTLSEYPHWIRLYDRKKSSWKIDILRMMRESKYDLIHAHAELPIFASFSGKPFIAQTMGSDLSEMVFTNSLRGIFLRRAYKKAKVILYGTPDQPSLLKQLKMKNTVFLPLISDFSFFKPQKIVDERFKDKFVIFHPASHIWDIKGNDIIIISFSKFLKINPHAILIIINWGKDRERSKELVKSLGIENNVLILEQLSAKELLYYYNICDVVADQFIQPGIGAIGIETLFCEKPLIIKCDENAYHGLYPEPIPLLNASTVAEILEKLKQSMNEKTRFQLAKNGKEWAEKYLSPNVIARKSVSIYESVLNGDKIGIIREKISEIT